MPTPVAWIRSYLAPREDLERPGSRKLYVFAGLLVGLGILIVLLVLFVFLAASVPHD